MIIMEGLDCLLQTLRSAIRVPLEKRIRSSDSLDEIRGDLGFARFRRSCAAWQNIHGSQQQSRHAMQFERPLVNGPGI
jgi:hypothetical protein